MKKYKSENLNEQVREAVRAVREYDKAHMSVSRSYYDQEEFTYFVMDVTNVTSYNMARKVVWIYRADGDRDIKALQVWGFNQHTA